jgi:hypothetical protein
MIQEQGSMKFSKCVVLAILTVISLFLSTANADQDSSISSSLTAVTDRVLEAKDVLFFKVELVSKSPETIRLSGTSGASALSVRKIETVIRGHSMRILVHLVLATEGSTGTFDFPCVIPSGVDTVTFGDDNVMLWTRSDGILFESEH